MSEPAPEEAFASWVEDHLGLQRGGPLQHEWDGVCAQRLAARGARTFEAYRQSVEGLSESREELELLAQRLTVGETYFFRENQQLEVLAKVVIPGLQRARGNTPIRLLCVGCSSGEEAYSICITAREVLGGVAPRLGVEAFDLNPEAVRRARAARYSDWSLRVTPPALRAKYFERRQGQHQLIDPVRDDVAFHVRNLFEDDADYWRPGAFDVVFCRNLLIYFSRRKIGEALDRLSSALAPDGYLFLGHSESPRGLSDRLKLEEVSGAFCYRPAGHTLAGCPGPSLTAPEIPPVATTPSSDTSWCDEIDSHTRKLDALAAGSGRGVAPAGTADLAAELSRTIELIREERFEEAITHIDAVQSRSPTDEHGAALQLARAVVLTNRGRLREAETECRALLEAGRQSAGAHYLLGLAQEQQGECHKAIQSYRAAARADCSLVMAHYRLGQLAGRHALLHEARLHFGLAIAGLESCADPLHALFDGGVSRAAIYRLCVAGLEGIKVRR